MAEVFTIEIATPSRLLAREEAVRAQIPGEDGYLGILPGHAALISKLGIGVLTFAQPNQKVRVMAVKGGFVEILSDVVRVLTDNAELGSEVDVSAAGKELQKAQEAFVNPALGIDIASALIAARHAQARIDAAKKHAAGEE